MSSTWVIKVASLSLSLRLIKKLVFTVLIYSFDSLLQRGNLSASARIHSLLNSIKRERDANEAKKNINFARRKLKSVLTCVSVERQRSDDVGLSLTDFFHPHFARR